MSYPNAFAHRRGFWPSCRTLQLERRPMPTVDEFRARYLHRRAAIFTGMMAGAGCARWTLESLAREFGGIEVKLSTFRQPFSSVWRMRPTEPDRLVSLSTALEQVARLPSLINIAIPVGVAPVDEPRARFRAALPSLPYDLGRLESYNTFFSSTHVSWGVHKDIGTEQVLFQIIGRKAVVLFPDDRRNTRALTPMRHPHKEYFRSQLPDVEQVSPRQFPRFAGAEAHLGILEPGDALYMPCAWWHDTRPLGTAFSLNMRHRARPLTAIANQISSVLYSRL